MSLDAFYAIVSGACFALVGLWWNVVSTHPKWMKGEATRRTAGGVYLAFLIPALMSLGAQIGGDNKLVWRAVFVVAALLGGFFAVRLIAQTRDAINAGLFSKSRWLIVLVYVFIFGVALYPDVAKLLSLTGLQVEAFLICLLILMGHGLAWEFMMQDDKEK